MIRATRRKAWLLSSTIVALCAIVIVLELTDFAHSPILLVLTLVLAASTAVLADFMARLSSKSNLPLAALPAARGTSRYARARIVKIAIALALCVGITTLALSFALDLSLIDWLIAAPVIVSAFAWGALSRWRRLK